MNRKDLKKLVEKAFQLYEVGVQEGWRPSHEESESENLVPMPRGVLESMQRIAKTSLDLDSRGDRYKAGRFHAVLDDELLTLVANAIWNAWQTVMSDEEFPSKLWCSHLELRYAFRNPTTPSAQQEAVSKLHAIRDRWLVRLGERPKLTIQLKDQAVARRIRRQVKVVELTETEYCIVKLIYERPPVDTPTISNLCGTTSVHRHVSTINTKLKKLNIKLKGRYNVGYTLIET